MEISFLTNKISYPQPTSKGDIKQETQEPSKGQEVLTKSIDCFESSGRVLAGLYAVKKPSFSTLEEAHSYFDSQYGIKAKFDTLEQAQTVKETLDDFAKLTYKRERLFEGIRIESGKPMDGRIASTDVKFNFCYPNKLLEKMNNLDSSQEFTQKRIKFLKHHKPTEIYPAQITIILDKDFDWGDNSRRTKRKMSQFVANPTLKGAIAHELGHVLHVKHAPYEYCVSGLKDTKEKERIREKVSPYSSECGAEFVAEYISGKYAGKVYSEEVEELYKKYNGPNLFGEKR